MKVAVQCARCGGYLIRPEGTTPAQLAAECNPDLPRYVPPRVRYHQGKNGVAR